MEKFAGPVTYAAGMWENVSACADSLSTVVAFVR
jgi:hypothetical protein